MNPFRWRKMTWAVLVFTGLAVLIGAGVVAVYVDAGQCDPEITAECSPTWALTSAAGIWLSATFCVWFLGFVILSIVWFMTRHERRLCPACGFDVRKGQRVCARCGYRFDAQVIAAPPSSAAVASVPRNPSGHRR